MILILSHYGRRNGEFVDNVFLPLSSGQTCLQEGLAHFMTHSYFETEEESDLYAATSKQRVLILTNAILYR